MEKKEAPNVYVRPRKDFPKGWEFFCVYCQQKHLHGEGLGHRAAHCINPDSPYRETGYNLTSENNKPIFSDQIPILYTSELNNFVWRRDPTKYEYVRKHQVLRIKEEYNKIPKPASNEYLVGYEILNKHSFYDTQIAIYFTIRKYDRGVCDHKNVKDCYYCENPTSYPQEAVKIYGEIRITSERRPTSGKDKHFLLFKANYRCEECGITNKDEVLEVDHKIPVAKGGSDDITNKQILCRPCNRAKGTDIW